MSIDDEIEHIMRETRVIAVVGLSPRPERPSHAVAQFLKESGFRIIPVNPGHDGEMILGERCRARLSDIPDAENVDMVDIFRRAEAIPAVVSEALAALPNLRTVWMQLGLRSAAAAALAQARGITVIEDRCPRIEFPRHPGALSARAADLAGLPVGNGREG